MSAIEATARGGGPYIVYVDGAEYSSHVAEREAIENASEALRRNPSARVHYVHDYVVDVRLVELSAPEPPEEPVPIPGGDVLVSDEFAYRGLAEFLARYPRGRAGYAGFSGNKDFLGPDTAQMEADGIVTCDGPLRLRYGAGAAQDILAGPQSFGRTVERLRASFTFRVSPGADPAAGNSSSLKGFMFWDSFPGRREWRPCGLRYGGSRWDGSWGDDDSPRWQPGGGWPENAATHIDFWRTADGLPPSWTPFADGALHEFGYECYSGQIPVTERGERVYLDGALVFDNVGRLPALLDLWGRGIGVDWNGNPVTSGLQWKADRPRSGFSVWGNFVDGTAASRTPQFAVEFHRWAASVIR